MAGLDLSNGLSTTAVASIAGAFALEVGLHIWVHYTTGGAAFAAQLADALGVTQSVVESTGAVTSVADTAEGGMTMMTPENLEALGITESTTAAPGAGFESSVIDTSEMSEELPPLDIPLMDPPASNELPPLDIPEATSPTPAPAPSPGDSAYYSTPAIAA